MSIRATLTDLKDQYCALHEAKEDLFWVTKMDLAEDADDANRKMASAEIALNRFLQDPDRLSSLRGLSPGDEREARVLRGWVRVFESNTIEDPKARALSEEIVELESQIGARRKVMNLGYVDPDTKQLVRASTNKLYLVQRTDRDEARRKAAHEALRSIEPFVLEAGFLDLVTKRNRLARMLGYEDYYAYRLWTLERMTKERLFGLFDELSRRTKSACDAALARFSSAHGDGALEPYNFVFHRAGELTRELDPYYRFGQALERWARAFVALGVRYRGATLTLDLVDRPGKYENGFMHGPGLAFYDDDRFRPARINFTANAVPGQVGSGYRATQTLFHEGGHAAHFSNILMDAPCFSQEFAPTSVAYAETQSMFMDSLIDDPDFRTRYALDDRGRTMPAELLERAAYERQALRAFDVRAMMTVPYAERRIYELEERELTPDRVLAELRKIEQEMQGLTAGVRPVLAVPHLLAGESSAYYHGYVLAEMGVEQTRDLFLSRDGALIDNPRVGRDLAEHYWKRGNDATFDDTLQSLTGSPLAVDALAAACNRSPDEAAKKARDARAGKAPEISLDLDATVRVVHGRQLVATSEDGGLAKCCDAFRSFIERLESQPG